MACIQPVNCTIDFLISCRLIEVLIKRGTPTFFNGKVKIVQFTSMDANPVQNESLSKLDDSSLDNWIGFDLNL